MEKEEVVDHVSSLAASLIWPVRGHRIERIGERHDARARGNLIAFQAVGIAIAVDAFVVITRHQRYVRVRMRNRREDFVAG